MLAASALIPVIGALSSPTSLQGLIYSIFVVAYLAPTLLKNRKKKKADLKEGEIQSVLPAPEDADLKKVRQQPSIFSWSWSAAVL